VQADEDNGILFLVSTPIGNLEDISLRALRILKEADLIAAEDTRRTGRLLKHYEIDNTQTSYHDHNKQRKTPSLVSRLKEGERVAVVTDAGTPGVSDPAYYLVRAAINAGIPVSPVPGPSAVIAALVSAGLPTDSFIFDGFLPVKKKRRKKLRSLSRERRTIVLYESPHRLLRTLGDIREFLGDRECCICREITKKFEEFLRGNISELQNKLAGRTIKGEIVLVIKGAAEKNVQEKKGTPDSPEN